MRRFHWLVLMGVTAFVIAACNKAAEPPQMEKLINDDRASFIKLARALQDAGATALKAIDAKNAEGLLDAGETIDTACENCHLKYWYPLDQQAQKAKEGAGSVKKS